MNKKIIAILSAVIVLLGGGGYYASQLGGVTTGQGYYSSSTPYDTSQVSGQIVEGSGILGQLTVTGYGDLYISVLDATTTVVANRPTAKQSTSSAELFRIQLDEGADLGSYTFDVVYNYGLYLDVIAGTNGSTTITYRPE